MNLSHVNANDNDKDKFNFNDHRYYKEINSDIISKLGPSNKI